MVFVGLRVYARAGLIRATGSDDWIIAAAAAVGIAYAATGIAGTHTLNPYEDNEMICDQGLIVNQAWLWELG